MYYVHESKDSVGLLYADLFIEEYTPGDEIIVKGVSSIVTAVTQYEKQMAAVMKLRKLRKDFYRLNIQLDANFSSRTSRAREAKRQSRQH